MRIRTAIILLIIPLSFSYLSCDKGIESDDSLDTSSAIANNDPEESALEFSGSLTAHTGCKQFSTLKSSMDYPDTISRIEYQFIPLEGRLIVRHINAGFNCCPDSLYSVITLSNDSILIHEHENLYNEDGEIIACRCLCLYDLDIEINGLDAREYHLFFSEPYIAGMQEISFPVNLADSLVGAYSVSRSEYPWGESQVK